jgi:hypothetical protein
MMARILPQAPDTLFSFSENTITSAKLQKEEIYIHTDRNKYIAGENIWLSIYDFNMLTGGLSTLSSVAYVEIINPFNVPVMQARFFISGGRGQGVLLLPDSLASGTYKIRAYTNWMKNFLPRNCFIKNISVYNPFAKQGFRQNANSEDCLTIKERGNSEEKNSRHLSLEADTVFGRREKVSVKLKTDKYTGIPGKDFFSVSVSSSEASSGSLRLDEYIAGRMEMVNDSADTPASPLFYSFERNGHQLSVRINYREKDKVDSAQFVYLSVQGKVAEFNYAERDKYGTYTFTLPIDTRYRNLILQPEHANNNMMLEIVPSFPRITDESQIISESLQDSLLPFFEKLSFNYQAGRIYGLKPKTEISETPYQKTKKRRFYGIPEMEIFLDDYIKLPSMQEVFYELLPGINFVSRKSGYEILITNPLTGVFFNEPPLVMIDGVIINDLNVLANLDPEAVEKIEVVKTPYLFGDLILYGIVNVLTRSGDFNDIVMPEFAVILPYRVVERPAWFTAPDYSNETARVKRIPDLRNTIYWNPSVWTDIKGEAVIEFWTSDIPGRYIIVIEGVTGTGHRVSARKTFTVK